MDSNRMGSGEKALSRGGRVGKTVGFPGVRSPSGSAKHDKNSMANMFKKVKANSVTEYINSVPEDRKKTIKFLHNFIQKSAPKLKPHFTYNMLGYGNFKYTNYKKEIIDWPIIAMASQKNYYSIYVCALDGKKYLAEKYKSKLGKVSVGRSCIRFKKLEDLNLETLKEVIKIASKSPGLVSSAK